MLLDAQFGDIRILARPNDRRLCLLDRTASVLWDLHAIGLTPDTMAELLATQFGSAETDTRPQIARLFADWREAGLLDAYEGVFPAQPSIEEPNDGFTCPAPLTPNVLARGWRLALAGIQVGLEVADTSLRSRLAQLISPLVILKGTVSYQLAVSGTANCWILSSNGIEFARGVDADSALITILHTLTEIGCRATTRLMVIHGAGLELPSGGGLLLIAPGGFGKTTLAARLDKAGFGLLSDDVVPVDLDGKLIGLGLPLCIKSGSWPVLTSYRPDLIDTKKIERLGQKVCYLPALFPRVASRLDTRLIIFPRYHPDAAPSVTPMSVIETLQGIVEAEAVIRGLDQAKLNSILHWIAATPAFAITYPDLDAAMILVQHLVIEQNMGHVA